LADGEWEVGSLGNVLSSPDGRCYPSPYSYCDVTDRIKFSGPESIIGRSAVLHKNKDIGADTNPILANHPDFMADPMACGTIGTDIFNPEMNLLPVGATAKTGGACADEVDTN